MKARRTPLGPAAAIAFVLLAASPATAQDQPNAASGGGTVGTTNPVGGSGGPNTADGGGSAPRVVAPRTLRVAPAPAPAAAPVSTPVATPAPVATRAPVVVAVRRAAPPRPVAVRKPKPAKRARPAHHKPHKARKRHKQPAAPTPAARTTPQPVVAATADDEGGFVRESPARMSSPTESVRPAVAGGPGATPFLIALALAVLMAATGRAFRRAPAGT
jgi:hypothetical protein